jgi:hypothetical protein
VQVEGRVDPALSARGADALGRLPADAVARQLPEADSTVGILLTQVEMGKAIWSLVAQF